MMQNVRRPLAAVALVLALTATAAAQGREYRTFRPEGAGPFPAVMFVSGCSGFTPSIAPNAYTRFAEQLRQQGYLVIFVDYLTPRGLTSCRGRVSIDEVSRDILTALSHVRSRPFVDASRIAVIGWSWGGGGTLAALATLRSDEPASFRAAVFYPYCRGLTPWMAKVPVLMLLGGLDEVTPAQECQGVVKRLATGTPVEVRLYPEARHGFDADELPPMTTYPGGVIGHHPSSAAAARQEIERFLQQ